MKKNFPRASGINRREFLRGAAIAAGAAWLSPWAFAETAATVVKRTATDQVLLGSTGIQLSRLGFGTGSDNGYTQTALGRDGFNDLIHYAYDQGITYIDTAQRYQTFTWIAGAIKGLPREKLFIQSKLPSPSGDVLAAIDHHRKVFNTDYVDSLLVHCMTRGAWTDEWKRAMDAFNEAKEKKWIRAKGVSCHTLPALRAATQTDWTEVHLVRVNPQGAYTDTEQNEWSDTRNDISPVMQEIKTMRAKGRGIIGMKIIGNGAFQRPEDREKSIRFAMSCKEIDAIVIGFSSRGQIKEAIERMNRALA